jgi:hypothetical protein
MSKKHLTRTRWQFLFLDPKLSPLTKTETSPTLEQEKKFMARVTEHLSKAEIEEKIARLVREHHAADPIFEAHMRACQNTFWFLLGAGFAMIAGFFTVIALRG